LLYNKKRRTKAGNGEPSSTRRNQKQSSYSSNTELLVHKKHKSISIVFLVVNTAPCYLVFLVVNNIPECLGICLLDIYSLFVWLHLISSLAFDSTCKYFFRVHAKSFEGDLMLSSLMFVNTAPCYLAASGKAFHCSSEL